MSQKIEYDADTNDIAVRPYLDEDKVRELLSTHFEFALDPSFQMKEYDCYDGRNYLVKGTLVDPCGRTIKTNPRESIQSDEYVLKIFNADSSARFAWFSTINKIVNECSVILAARDAHFSVPFFKHEAVLCEIALTKDVYVECPSSLDEMVASNDFVSKSGDVYFVQHMTRLSAHIPGRVVEVEGMNGTHAFNFGVAVAKLDLALKDIPSYTNNYQETFDWNILYLKENEFYSRFVETMNYGPERMTMIKAILEVFQAKTLPKLQKFPQHWIHGDVNEHNILFRNESTDVAGIIDFDDMIRSTRVVEIGTSLMHITVSSDSMKRCMLAKQFYQGYCSISPLDEIEVGCIFSIMLVRYVLCCCVGDYQYEHVDPTNPYVIVQNGWPSVEYFYTLGGKRFLNDVLSERS